MTELLKKGVKFFWDDKYDQAFQALRKLLTSAPVLAQPDITRPFDVYCDASGTSLGRILITAFGLARYYLALTFVCNALGTGLGCVLCKTSG